MPKTKTAEGGKTVRKVTTPSTTPAKVARSKAADWVAPVVGAATREEFDVRTRLLDAAEQLFADRGFNGVSTRQISAKARANQGAIPYYFSTKENLLREVFLRRIGTVQEERHIRMKALTDASKVPDVTAVLHALLEPAFRQSRESEHFRRLAGRLATDPTPEVRRMLHDLYSADNVYVHKALRAACPKLNDKEFYWRLYCVYGVMLYVQADTGKIQTLAGKEFDTSQPDVAIKYVMSFLVAGMNAPQVK